MPFERLVFKVKRPPPGIDWIELVLQVAVVLVCMFLGFYLLPVSYALMTFFVTTMSGVLYGLLGRFSVGFLEIRLVETVVGAAAGAVAALIVLPIRTWGVVADRVFCGGARTSAPYAVRQCASRRVLAKPLSVT